MTGTPQSFAHVGITVGDLDAAVAFWHDVLGFSPVVESVVSEGPEIDAITGVQGARTRVTVLARANQMVELLEYEKPAARERYAPRPCDIGSIHVAVDVDDIETAVAAGGRHGWTTRAPVVQMSAGPLTGVRVVYLWGPDGTAVELMQHPDRE
ncbi:VOC family protein [Mangrovihabitans endophyticus]|uniref:VOC domain-containing protein n=1 Tax=Mangrovihabitans endophyticus TaxID=1751298 RepID=A0A8J3BUJ4_9ACTN|nr:VOC family protein [Mangrovihabitans endophyticus]GGK78621.1 hypothetical protein GCM10012284_10670 [Mangrovihabitans endophyticus]